MNTAANNGYKGNSSRSVTTACSRGRWAQQIKIITMKIISPFFALAIVSFIGINQLNGQNNSTFELYGKIGSSLKSVFVLNIDKKNSIEGYFYYMNEPNKKIPIIGILKGNSLKLNEYNNPERELTGTFVGNVTHGNYVGNWSSPDKTSLVEFSYQAKSDYDRRQMVDFNQIWDIIKYEFSGFDICKYFNESRENCKPIYSIAYWEEFNLEKGYRLYSIITVNPNEYHTCNACSPIASIFVFRIENGNWILDSKDIQTELNGWQGEYYFGSFKQLGRNIVGISEVSTIYAQGIHLAKGIYSYNNGNLIRLNLENDIDCNINDETEGLIGFGEYELDGCICCYEIINDGSSFFPIVSHLNVSHNGKWNHTKKLYRYSNGKYREEKK